MTWFRLFSRPGRDADDRELDEEIRSHLAMSAAEFRARGESPDGAVAAAHREFGNVAHVKEVTREAWGGLWFERLLQDLHYAARSLRRAPVFAITAVLTLALGIGVNTAMFTVVRSVLLRPLPFAAPNELFVISHLPDQLVPIFGTAMTNHEYDDFARVTRAFRSTTSYHAYPATLLDAGEPSRIPVAAVTSSFFATLGVAPRYGHPFVAADETPGTPPSVILSASLWRERFGGDSSVIGRSVRVDDSRATVVGIMPDGFDFPRRAQVWLPLQRSLDSHNARLDIAIGRLAGGATPSGALAELRQFAATEDRQEPPQQREHSRAEVVSLQEAMVGDVRTPLVLFAAAIGIVLLIACVNVSNLMLMRANARRVELGIRTALGARRSRLVRQLLTEALVVGLAGGLIGLGIAFGGVRLLLSLMPPGVLPRASEIHVDPVVVALTLVACLATGVAAGVVPALSASRNDVRAIMGDASRATHRSALRHALVVVEAALSLVLLVGAGLMIRSFARLRNTDLGFTPDHVATATVDLPASRYRTAEAVHAFVAEIDDRLRAIPNVRSAEAVTYLPFDSTYTSGDFTRFDRQPLPQDYMVLKPCVTAAYFSTMGIRVLKGRGFLPSDDASGERVAIVSDAVAKRLWPSGAVGQRISYSETPGPNDWITIVGVVADVVRDDPAEEAPTPAIYRPIVQIQTKDLFFINHLTFVTRTVGDPSNVVSPIRAAVHAVDAEQPIQSIATMDSHVRDAIASPRFRSIMTALFSAMALLLAAIGIYGVLAYAVTERTRELGIRIALGASPRSIFRLVLGTTARLVVPGVIIGTFAALLGTRLLASFLFHVRPTDPPTYIVASVVLLSVAIMAGLGPARRAARVDPVLTMK